MNPRRQADMSRELLTSQVYFPGDVFAAPPPLAPEVRFRVRAVEVVAKMGPWCKPLGLVHQYVLQIFTVTGPGTLIIPCTWGWMDVSHDRRYTEETIQEYGLVLEIKAAAQMMLF